jgi:hypothetical protein
VIELPEPVWHGRRCILAVRTKALAELLAKVNEQGASECPSCGQPTVATIRGRECRWHPPPRRRRRWRGR